MLCWPRFLTTYSNTRINKPDSNQVPSTAMSLRQAFSFFSSFTLLIGWQLFIYLAYLVKNWVCQVNVRNWKSVFQTGTRSTVETVMTQEYKEPLNPYYIFILLSSNTGLCLCLFRLQNLSHNHYFPVRWSKNSRQHLFRFCKCRTRQVN